MPHIHSKPGQHDFTVSAHIIRQDNNAESVILLHKHKILDKYLQFGGHVELDEDPWQAISHELAEESGYNIAQLRVLQPISRMKKVTGAVIHPYPVSILTHQFGNTDHYHTDIAYAFVTDEMPAGTIGDKESADIRTFSASELANLSTDEIPTDVREIGLFVFSECLKNWVAVTTDFSL